MGETRLRALFTRQVSPSSRQPSHSPGRSKEKGPAEASPEVDDHDRVGNIRPARWVAGGAASVAAHASDEGGELAGIVEKVERREVVASAGIVLAALARAIQDTAIEAGSGLARLHIDGFTVQRDFSADGDAPVVAVSPTGSRPLKTGGQ